MGDKVIRILQLGLGNKFGIGGIETYLLNQYRHIDKKQFQYDFIQLTDEEMAFANYFSGNSVIYKIPERSKHPFAYYYEMIKLFFYIRKANYGAIVFNMGGVEQALPLVLAKLVGIPMRIAHSHAAGTEIELSFFRKIQYVVNRKLLKFSVTEYWACSKEASKFLFHHNNAMVVHNGIETKKFIYSSIKRKDVRNSLNVSDKFVIGHVGRFSPVKNHFFLLDVFYELYKKNEHAVLLFVGDDSNVDQYDGYTRRLKEKIEYYGISSAVYFTGYTEEVEKYYQAMDVFCLPSHTEGLPICTLEAQASDLPCVVSTGVPNTVKVIDDVHFIPLEKNSWADILYAYSKAERSRQDNYNIFCRSGYDAQYSTKEVEKHFLEVLNGE